MDDNNRPTIFYLDRIRVNFYLELGELTPHFQPGQLRQLLDFEQRNNVALHEAPPQIRKYWFKTTLDIIAPTSNGLDILHEFDRSLMKVNKTPPYKVSRLEVACDTICESKREAVQLTDDMCRRLTLKWMSMNDSTDYHFDPHAYDPAKSGKSKDGFITASSTHYCGGRSMELCGYSRISKIERKPCCHLEFQLKKSASIRSRAGIETLQDLTTENIQGCFQRLWTKYAHQGDFDRLRLGKWLLRREGLRFISDSTRREALKQANLFCTLHGIHTFKDLRLFIQKEQATIRDRYQGFRGRKADRDQRFLDLKPSRFKA